MALNFPSPSESTVYFDPTSGLKYLWNSAIGAWETAIQPPAIIDEDAPNINLEGFLWWDSNDDDELGGRLYVYYDGAWVEATPYPDIPVAVEVSSVPPATPQNGDLWWDETNGRLYVFYEDDGGGNPVLASSQWVDASPEALQPQGLGNANITTSPEAPTNPIQNDLWFNSTNGNLYIYYKDVDGGAFWVSTVDYGTTQSAAGGLKSFVGTGAVSIGGTLSDPIVGIRSASTTQTGVMRLATETEAAAGTLTSVALSPALLKNNISSYVTAASATASGIVELATSAETITGTDTAKAVTPKALKDAVPSLGLSNPTGTIIEFATSTPPTGYLTCDGSLVSRTTYSDLFALIGTTYGGGDGATTFKLPTLTHTNSLMIYCIKS